MSNLAAALILAAVLLLPAACVGLALAWRLATEKTYTERDLDNAFRAGVRTARALYLLDTLEPDAPSTARASKKSRRNLHVVR